MVLKLASFYYITSSSSYLTQMLIASSHSSSFLVLFDFVIILLLGFLSFPVMYLEMSRADRRFNLLTASWGLQRHVVMLWLRLQHIAPWCIEYIFALERFSFSELRFLTLSTRWALTSAEYVSLSTNDSVAAVALYYSRTSMRAAIIPSENECERCSARCVVAQKFLKMLSTFLSTSLFIIVYWFEIDTAFLDIRPAAAFGLCRSPTLHITSIGWAMTLQTTRGASLPNAEPLIYLACWHTSVTGIFNNTSIWKFASCKFLVADEFEIT